MVVSYCKAVKIHEEKSSAYARLHRKHHDEVHGRFPISDDEFFARLTMEIHQAGLNWGLILSKEAALRKAYCDFCIAKVATFTKPTIDELLHNSDIIRSEAKIKATIYNAASILEITKTHSSCRAWLLSYRGSTLAQWTAILKSKFTFIGQEVTKELLTGIGILPGAHHHTCPVGKRIKKIPT
ncbi:MAG: DNA-3-methyladenine glycosylase I [Methylacidiphilales bacterium]|nr:DNA-3-methyladenine glycosylase I [Candidatus Methylacidiphilales bacterium]